MEWFNKKMEYRKIIVLLVSIYIYGYGTLVYTAMSTSGYLLGTDIFGEMIKCFSDYLYEGGIFIYLFIYLFIYGLSYLNKKIFYGIIFILFLYTFFTFFQYYQVSGYFGF